MLLAEVTQCAQTLWLASEWFAVYVTNEYVAPKGDEFGTPYVRSVDISHSKTKSENYLRTNLRSARFGRPHDLGMFQAVRVEDRCWCDSK